LLHFRFVSGNLATVAHRSQQFVPLNWPLHAILNVRRQNEQVLKIATAARHPGLSR
jgi:hypothetical protein